MRHLIEPTNLSTKEIDDLMNLATDIINHKEKYSDAKVRNWLPYSMNQVHAQD